jgi:hypothetical protein
MGDDCRGGDDATTCTVASSPEKSGPVGLCFFAKFLAGCATPLKQQTGQVIEFFSSYTLTIPKFIGFKRLATSPLFSGLMGLEVEYKSGLPLPGVESGTVHGPQPFRRRMREHPHRRVLPVTASCWPFPMW